MDLPTAALDQEENPFQWFDNGVAGDVCNPYPDLAEARRTTPIQELPGFPGAEDPPPLFVIFRHDDVARVLRDNHNFSSSTLKETMGASMGEQIILGMDE